MSVHNSSASSVDLPHAPASLDTMAADPSRDRMRRLKNIVLATVLGWNAAAMAALCIWAEVAAHTASQDDGENWTGVIIGIILAVMTVTILISTAIGVPLALARVNRPVWLSRLSTVGGAVLAGTRTAAWGLCAILPIPLLALASSALGT